MSNPETKSLLEKNLRVINIGLERFAWELNQQGVEVVNVDWSPPAGGDTKIGNLLSKLGT